MKLTISYSGMARAVARTASETFDLPAATTLPDLLAQIAKRHGERMAHLVTPDDQGVPPVLIFVGDEQVTWPSAPSLKDGDQIMLLSPIAGG
jgi:molybdopterin converting factor small subunit